ncbi:unnamed protein product, partial [Ectocarpus sp. 13 AM-2016]
PRVHGIDGVKTLLCKYHTFKANNWAHAAIQCVFYRTTTTITDGEVPQCVRLCVYVCMCVCSQLQYAVPPVSQVRFLRRTIFVRLFSQLSSHTTFLPRSWLASSTYIRASAISMPPLTRHPLSIATPLQRFAESNYWQLKPRTILVAATR